MMRRSFVLNAQEVYEFVKWWQDHWPEGLEYTQCESITEDGDTADLMMWTLNLDGINEKHDEEAWKDEEDTEAACSMLTPIAATRMLIDRACELFNGGIFPFNDKFIAITGDKFSTNKSYSTRLEAASEGLKSFWIRQQG